jgi:hypothetical protein
LSDGPVQKEKVTDFAEWILENDDGNTTSEGDD